MLRSLDTVEEAAAFIAQVYLEGGRDAELVARIELSEYERLLELAHDHVVAGAVH